MFDFLNERNKTKIDVKKLKVVRNPLYNRLNNTRHPKCLGYFTQDTGWGSEFNCEYESKLDCEQCKYGMGKKNPAAKCNQSK